MRGASMSILGKILSYLLRRLFFYLFPLYIFLVEGFLRWIASAPPQGTISLAFATAGLSFVASGLEFPPLTRPSERLRVIAKEEVAGNVVIIHLPSILLFGFGIALLLLTGALWGAALGVLIKPLNWEFQDIGADMWCGVSGLILGTIYIEIKNWVSR